MNKIFIIFTFLLIFALFENTYAEEILVEKNEIIKKLDKINGDSTTTFYYTVALSGAFLVVSICIAVLIYEKTNKDSKKHRENIKKFTKTTLLLHDGNFYYNEKRFKEAKKNYEDLLKIDEYNEKALHNLGSTLLNLKKYPEAIEIYQKILDSNKQNIGAWSNLGIAYFYDDNFTEAGIAYYTGLKINLDDGNTTHNLALLYDKGFSDQDFAIRIYNRIIEKNLLKDDELAEVYFNKAKIFSDSKKLPEALELLDEGLKHDRNNLKILTEKASTLYFLDKPFESLACCDIVLKIDPLQSIVLTTKANALTKLLNPTLAMKAINEYINRFPEDYIGHYIKGRIYRISGDFFNAQLEWRKTLEFNVNMISAHDGLAEIEMARGNFTEALEIYEQVRNETTNIEFLINMGVCLCANNEPQRAIVECFNEAFELQPQNPNLLWIMSRAFEMINHRQTSILCLQILQRI